MANSRRKLRQCAVPSARIIPISTRPRLLPGDFVELIGDVLPGNAGKIAVVRTLNDDGWIGIDSISGPLRYRNRESGIIGEDRCWSLSVSAKNLYRLDRNSVAKGVCHV